MRSGNGDRVGTGGSGRNRERIADDKIDATVEPAVRILFAGERKDIGRRRVVDADQQGVGSAEGEERSELGGKCSTTTGVRAGEATVNEHAGLRAGSPDT